MLTKWVLVLVILRTDSMAATSVEFDDPAPCHAAAESLKSKLHNGPFREVVAECFRKSGKFQNGVWVP